MRHLILLIFFLNCFITLSQDIPVNNNSSSSGFFNKIKDSMSIDNFQFDINKLKFYGINKDTVLLDTSLNIKKFYKFNYRKKDNLELLKFNNIGQVYNRLSFTNHNDIFTKIGYNANKSILINQSDYKFYDVAYPVTEFIFKSVYSQGQLTDALFTTNISRDLNLSLAFKALRSLGKYQNNLSGSKHFRFSFSYTGKKIDSKIFFISQKLEKHENGGLNDSSLIDFESGNQEFKERSKLNVNFEDAQNIYQTRNFYFNNKFTLINKKENLVSISYNLDYETTNNKFEQDQSSYLYGSIVAGKNKINDHYKFRSLKNTFSIDTNTKLLDELTLSFINYNYNFFDVRESIEKISGENSNLVFANLVKSFDNLKIKFNIHQKINGQRIGNKLDLSFESLGENKFNYKLNLNLSQSHPGIIYDIYQSDYSDIQFNSNLKLSDLKKIEIKFDYQNFGNLNIEFSNILNHFYITTNNSLQNKLAPILNQHENPINYLKVRYNKDLKFGIFSLDNSILFQKVKQTNNIINLPKILIRNTLYISEKVFNNILDIQSGLSLKMFSKFYANEYNPLLSTFHVQTDKKIGGYPIVDFFVNAKIRQTLIFLVAEHVNSSFSSGKYLSSPTNPYRDSSIRFGLKWNLFN